MPCLPAAAAAACFVQLVLPPPLVRAVALPGCILCRLSMAASQVPKRECPPQLLQRSPKCSTNATTATVVSWLGAAANTGSKVVSCKVLLSPWLLECRHRLVVAAPLSPWWLECRRRPVVGVPPCLSACACPSVLLPNSNRLAAPRARLRCRASCCRAASWRCVTGVMGQIDEVEVVKGG